MTLKTGLLKLLYALTLLLPVRTAECHLTRGPTDVKVLEGSTVVLPCYSDTDNLVLWYYDKPGGELLWEHVGDVELSDSPTPRLLVPHEPGSDGQYNLTIYEVKLSDSGTYKCEESFVYDRSEDENHRSFATVKLYVTANPNRTQTINCRPSSEIPLRQAPVMGVTVINDEIFVLRMFEVNVYDIACRTILRSISIPDLRFPTSFTGSAYNNALYIGDEMLKCIHRVDLTNNSVTRWDTRENHWPRGLSITAEHTLLVTILISDTRGRSRVVEYTSEGQLVREIKFDKSIEYAWHTVQLSRDQFIVSHGWPDYLLGRICIINSNGQIIQCYGQVHIGDQALLGTPYFFTVDFNRGHIFLFDSYRRGHRILLLSTDLAYQDLVDAPYDLWLPPIAYFDSSKNRLFLGEMRTGRLLVFNPYE